MIIILPKTHPYKIGNDFPLITIPTEGGNLQSGSFEDFQWWALSKDFAAWLKQNPRQWTAESESPRYSSLTQLIREHYGSLEIAPTPKEQKSRVLPFDEFSQVNEAKPAEEGQKEAQEDDIKVAVKLQYAYNTLLSKGKLAETITANEIATGGDMAVFLVVEDPDTGENLTETLKAFKISGIGEGTSEGSKIELLNVTEMVPGGKVAESDTPENIVTKVISGAMALGTAGLAAGGLHYLAIAGGGLYGGRALLRTIQGLRPAGASASALAKNASTLGKAGGWKTIFGKTGNFLKNTLMLKNFRAGLSGMARGLVGASKAVSLGKVGFSGAVKAFGTGASRGFAKAGGKLIPFVGEVLMVIDAVGSIWNWYSNNQAPRYNEVDSFAHNEMDPKKLPVGVPITVCWSQPAQSTFGSILSFVANNETRTTCELIKIGEKDGKSIFILTQINSASLQKQLMQHQLVLMYLDNSDLVNDQSGGFLGFGNKVARVFDNEDLDFEIAYFDDLEGMASVFNYQGACPWAEFMTTYQGSQDQLFVVDPDAPDTYQFYYKDPDDDIINVSGKLIPSDQLKNTDAEKLLGMFFPTKDQKFASKYTEEEKEEKIETKLETSESLTNPALSKLVLESGVFTSFGEFGAAINKLKEAESDENPEGEDVAVEDPVDPETSSSAPAGEEVSSSGGGADAAPVVQVKPNSDEGSDDEDAKDEGIATLKPKDLCGPAQVMIYYVTEKVYADPELRKYALRGSKFTNFLIDKADLDAKDGDKITVDINTVGGVNPKDPRRGVFTPQPTEDEEEEQQEIEGRTQQPQADVAGEEGGETKPEPIVTSPKDVKIRDRKNKLVIRDRTFDGGVNILDEFISDEDKEKLGISGWKAISVAKAKKNRRGEIDEIVLRNRFAPLGQKTKRFKITDGEPFEIAKKFVEEADERIRYR